MKHTKICFLGNMNNWPYLVAKRMVERGYDITLFVDAPRDYLLDRPEARDRKLAAGYPPWMVELKGRLGRSAVPFLQPRLAFRGLIRRLNEFDVVFLNGNWIALGQYLKEAAIVVNLFAGADLDFCAPGFAAEMARNKIARTGRPYPLWLLKRVYGRLWASQARGIRRAQLVDYHAPGVNPLSDAVLADIKQGQDYWRSPMRVALECEEFEYCEPDLGRRDFEILNVTRFDFLTKRNDNKRNDIMIKGIGQFVRENNIERDLTIRFFEKGADLDVAKALCRAAGIDRFITWHKIVPFQELIPLFRSAHVAFDQLGTQWINAGMYSMLVGRPLIANGRPDLIEPYFNEPSPVCQSTSIEDVSNWLTKLYRERSLIKTIGRASSDYIRKHHSIDKDIDGYLGAIEHFVAKRGVTAASVTG